MADFLNFIYDSNLMHTIAARITTVNDQPTSGVNCNEQEQSATEYVGYNTCSLNIMFVIITCVLLLLLLTVLAAWSQPTTCSHVLSLFNLAV